ncbi:MAG: cytochrome c [Casimicrobiaceae bacterium]
MRITALAAWFSIQSSIALAAPPEPFADGDPSAGKPLVEKDCVACHVKRLGGDGTRMYLRSDRRVNTAQQLLAQVRYCNTELGTNYFPDEEAHVAAFLNAQYYHFKP